MADHLRIATASAASGDEVMETLRDALRHTSSTPARCVVVGIADDDGSVHMMRGGSLDVIMYGLAHRLADEVLAAWNDDAPLTDMDV